MALLFFTTEYDVGDHNSNVIDFKITITHDNIVHKGVIEQ
jgi:hypothetical protein